MTEFETALQYLVTDNGILVCLLLTIASFRALWQLQIWLHKKLKSQNGAYAYRCITSFIMLATLVTFASAYYLKRYAGLLTPASLLLLKASVALLVIGIISSGLINVLLRFCIDQTNVFEPKIPIYKIRSLLSRLPRTFMTRKQSIYLSRCQAKVLVAMGALNKAEAAADTLSNDSYQMYLLSAIHFYQGNLSKSIAAHNDGEIRYRNSKDAFALAEQYINKGVCHVFEGNLRIADSEFAYALNFMKQHRHRCRPLVEVLFENYVINKARLNRMSEANELVETRIALWKPRTTSELVGLANLKLALLRESNCSQDDITSFIKSELGPKGYISKIRNKRKQLVAASSLLGISWSAQCDPQDCLDYINERRSYIDSLNGRQKYSVLMGLHELFRRMNPDKRVPYKELDIRSDEYFEKEAEPYIRKELARLPLDCIYMRTALMRELIKFLQQRVAITGIGIEEPEALLRETISLYRENSLNIETVQTEFMLIDSLIRPLDRSGRSTCEPLAEALDLMHDIEERLSGLMEHPYCASILIKLSYYHALLGNENESVSYFKRYQEINSSVKQYEPELVEQRAVAAVCARAFWLKDSILRIKHRQTVKGLERAYQFCQSFPNEHEGFLDAALVGCYALRIERCMIKTASVYCPNVEEPLFVHSWLSLELLDLDIDLTYCQFTEEAENSRSVFHYEHHPMESKRSRVIHREMSVRGASLEIDESEFGVEQLSGINLANELNAALTRLSVEEPISMEQLIQYLSEVPHLRQ